MILVPVEVIHQIFGFLDPLEVLRLRKISRQFRDISHEPRLWRDFYSNARLLLPPGPFPWQSARWLERTLVRSELLSKTWTTRPTKVVTRNSSIWRGDHASAQSWAVLLGRWCIWLEDETIIRCHDVDTNTHQVLYDSTLVDQPSIHFSACSTTDVSGQRIYILLLDFETHAPYHFRCLLMFDVNDNGLSDPKSFDLSHVYSEPDDVWNLSLSRQAQHRGTTSLLCVQQDNQAPLLFDVNTHVLYKLPRSEDILQDQTPPLPESDPSDAWTVIVRARTHVIAFRMAGVAPVVMQVFAVPDSDSLSDPERDGLRDLRLTHQGGIHLNRRCCHSFILLRNSRVDPVDKSTSIRLLHDERVKDTISTVSCIDLTLPNAQSPSDIPSIAVRSQHLFKSTQFRHMYEASDDGYVRGLMLEKKLAGQSNVRKFSIDASEEVCKTVIGDSSISPFSQQVMFDGFGGRVHFYQTLLVPSVSELPHEIVTVEID